MTLTARLALDDGRIFRGRAFGATGESGGEVVFNTALSGYQEVLTDPSYTGQMVVMTYPEIGNYGINREDLESRQPQVAGFIVKENNTAHSNWRASGSLEDYLREHGICGIEGIDTRALTAHLRDKGSRNAILSTSDEPDAALVERAKKLPSMVGLDLASRVTTKTAYDWTEPVPDAPQHQGRRLKVAVYDFGVKWNILRMLVSAGFDVRVYPAATPASEVLASNPDGVFLSNGPGDPEPVTYAVANIRAILGKKPVFGICLGHQLLGLAMGGKTYKLKFGHHGANQPVKDQLTGKVEITSQNHGFAVDVASIGDIAAVTHINLNDDTNEGLAHKKLPVFSVQYHPEASPGPHDASYLFERFRRVIETGKPVFDLG